MRGRGYDDRRQDRRQYHGERRMSEKRTQFQVLRDDWYKMSVYQRFESLVALTLTAVIGVIILVSLYKLIQQVGSGLLSVFFDPLQKDSFQVVFAEVLTVMIALELANRNAPPTP